jgi:TRAP-type uncharacterized transport system fused permease subunit
MSIGSLRMALEVSKAAAIHLRRRRFPLIGGIITSIMGTAVRNVVLTGRLTIPMMKARAIALDGRCD